MTGVGFGSPLFAIRAYLRAHLSGPGIALGLPPRYPTLGPNSEIGVQVMSRNATVPSSTRVQRARPASSCRALGHHTMTCRAVLTRDHCAITKMGRVCMYPVTACKSARRMPAGDGSGVMGRVRYLNHFFNFGERSWTYFLTNCDIILPGNVRSLEYISPEHHARLPGVASR